MAKLPPLVMEGRLQSYEQGDGWSAPCLSIGEKHMGESLDQFLVDHCGIEPERWRSLGNHDFGKVKITIEFLGD
jgi:hypothetical protein